jgi:putative acetyltransferase
MPVREATAEDLDQIRNLFREYSKLVTEGICFQSFEEELAHLPGQYAPPKGRILVVDQGELCGCVAMRPLSDKIAEVKRMYLRDSQRGQGLSRRLMRALIDAARSEGYERLRLDTLPKLTVAQRLYESLGFYDIPPYNDNPATLVRHMELSL